MSSQRKRFKSNDHDNTDDVLAKIDSKTKQIDELLAGFDNPNNSLNFIPSSLNKTSNNNNNNKSSPINNNTTNKSNNEITKTITITATSFKIEHHTQPTTYTQPIHVHTMTNTNKPIPKTPIHKLRPLPLPNAKPLQSCLKKTTFTTFRDEKRNKRRSSKTSSKDNNINNTESDINNVSKQRSRISFDGTVKALDGVSAKFYSSPQYLIRDGTYLRPKPFTQIENEKRLLQMLGAPEELAGRALPPGLLDEDWEEMYDPQIPNDYTSFVIARQRLQEWIEIRKEQRNIAYQKAMMASQYAQEYIENEIKREKEFEKATKRNKERDRDRDRDRSHRYKHRDRDRDRKRRNNRERRDRSRSRSRSRDKDREYYRRRTNKNENNNNKEYGYMGVLPTQSPLEAMHNMNDNNKETVTRVRDDDGGKLSGIDKAAKIMAKFGWKRGDGLGKSKQGLKGCLVPIKAQGGYNQLMSVQDPTSVLLLQNMASKGHVDVQLKYETVEECKHFGPVMDCIVYETEKKNVAKEQQVSVFVKFEYIESAMNALQRFNGRFFDARRVIASFFPLERFDVKDLDP